MSLTSFESFALRQRLLNIADILAIRDLRELSGYQDAAEDDGLALQVLLLAMFAALNDGSVCLKLDLAALSGRLLAFTDETAERAPRAAFLAEKIIARLPVAWPALIGDAGDFKPLIRAEREGQGYLYFQRYYGYAQKLRDQLARRASAGASPISEDDLKRVKTAVLKTYPVLVEKAGKKAPLVLDGEQELALDQALRRNLVLISGGPGTGKTSVMVSILRCLSRLGYDPARIRLAAPTGRAAYRMTEAIRRDLAALGGSSSGAPPPDQALLALVAQTLHRLLQYRPSTHDFTYHARNLLPADVLIIDEISMADVLMMSRVLEALPANAKLVLLGDKDQLPSVEAGAVLADLSSISAGGVTRVLLEKSHRSEQSILEVAGEINKGVAELVFKTDGVWHAGSGGWEGICGYRWVDLAALNSEPAGWPLFLDLWSEHQYLEKHAQGQSYQELIKRAAGRLDFSAPDETRDAELLFQIFNALQRAQILTLLRRGRYGCEGLNARISKTLRWKLDQQAEEEYFAGMPVLIMRNAYGLNLYNGDTGVVLKDRHGAYRAVFSRLTLNAAGQPQKSWVFFALDVLPRYEPAFAITVHKSQGGEYEQILLVAPPEEGVGEGILNAGADAEAQELPAHRLLTREILYTGLTRARHAAVLCGTKTMLARAIRNKIERYS